MTVKILMIEDHPSMIEGFKTILSYNDLGYEIETTAVYNCKKAYEIITNPKNILAFDFIFLDYSLPPFEEKNIFTGGDLALLAKEYFPETKVVIITSHTEAILLYKLIQKINPIGVLVKSDFTADDLIYAFKLMVDNKSYYSETVNVILKQFALNLEFLDETNREILSLLSQGILTKNMPSRIGISLSAIEKRKAIIRTFLNMPNGTDEDIIREAKKIGLV